MYTKHPTCWELTQVLLRLKLSEDDLAKLCGVTHWTVTRWVEGRLEIPKHVWSMLSIIAGMPVRDVISGGQMRYEVQEKDVFPDGFDRKLYIRYMRRFHPDLVRKQRNFIGEAQLLNECKANHDAALRGAKKTESNQRAG